MPRVFLICGFLALAAAQAASANPRNGEPVDAFDVLLKETSGPLAADGVRLSNQILSSITKNRKAVEDSKPERLRPEELGDTAAALQQLDRLSKQLMILGETAGQDFHLRRAEAQGIHGQIIGASRPTQAGMAYYEKARTTIDRSLESRMRELDQIKKLAQEEKWEQAETRLYKTLDQIAALAIFHSTEELRAIYMPYGEVQAAINQQMTRIRTQAAKELLTRLRDSLLPNLEAALQEAEAAAGAIASQGTAAIEGKNLDGPAALSHFAEKWKSLQIAAIRARAVHWALTRVPQGSYYGVNASSAGPTADPLEAQYAQFCDRMGSSLLKFVEADASRVSGAEVESLHQAYLAALSPLAMHVGDRRFGDAAQKALDGLTAKSPELREQAAVYRLATSEMLRWRRRAAEAAAKAHESGYPAAVQQLLQATQAKAPFAGLFAEQNPDVPRAQLFASAPAVVMWAEPKLLNQPILVPETTTVSAGKMGVSRYEDRTYCTVTLPALPVEQLASLERDLLTSQTAAPLSLAAFTALDSARRGDIAAAGGTIHGFQLEGVLPRFGAMPQNAWVLSPLGIAPKEEGTNDLLQHVLARFDVTPRWVRHEYFFAELSASQ